MHSRRSCPIGVSIAGLASTNTVIAGIGTVCTIAATAIYAFCEAWVDGKAAGCKKEDDADE